MCDRELLMESSHLKASRISTKNTVIRRPYRIILIIVYLEISLSELTAVKALGSCHKVCR